MDLSAAPLVLSPVTPIAAFAVGIGVTSPPPGCLHWRAARVAPMQALREAAIPPSPSL